MIKISPNRNTFGYQDLSSSHLLFHDSRLLETGDLYLIEAEDGCENLLRMGAKRRRRNLVTNRRPRQPQGIGDARRFNPVRALKIDVHATMANLRIGKHLVNPVDRPARYRCPFQRLHPFLRASLAHRLRDDGDKPSAVLHPRPIGGETQIPRNTLKPGDAAELLELAVRTDGDDHMPVTRFEALIGHDIGMCVTEPGRGLVAYQIVERLIGEHGDLCVQERDVDELPLTALLAMCKCGKHADDGIEPGEQIGEGDAALDRTGARLALGQAGDAHDAAHPLNHEVIAGALGIGPVLAESGDGTVDELRIELLQAVIVETIFLETADL